jgi:hypothetical protein
MAVNKLLEQRNNNSSELLEQLDAYETFEEINRRIARQRAINEIEQELRDAGKIDDRPWWRRLLRL